MKTRPDKTKHINIKKAVYVCDIAKNSLKIAKCSRDPGPKRVAALSVEAIPAGIDDKQLSQRISQALKKLGYRGDPIVISLPQTGATARYIKIPSQSAEEIEKIVSLQAPRYLPYPAEELISGYQPIRVNNDSSSDINMIIVHRDVVSRYITVFKDLKPSAVSVVLSSYGLCYLYHYLNPESTSPKMILDIDSDHAELAIAAGDKLLFSRYFKIPQGVQDPDQLIIDELVKTQNAYTREVANDKPAGIVISGTKKLSPQFIEAITLRTSLKVENIDIASKLEFSEVALEIVIAGDSSFSSIIGLGLEEAHKTLNLIPNDLKEEARKVHRREERVQAGLLVGAIVILWALGLYKNINVKAEYLKRLKHELSKVSNEARPLEDVERRFELLKERSKIAPSSLDVLYELYQVIPQTIALTNVSYDEDNEIILHGQAGELNAVFNLAGDLEKSPVFKEFNIRVRYATKIAAQKGEVIDFEIACVKR